MKNKASTYNQDFKICGKKLTKKWCAFCGHSKFSFEIITERTIELIYARTISPKRKKIILRRMQIKYDSIF